MGRELGRIGGQLLADNLRRNGANLAFDNDVLFLDVNHKFVGFNTDTPTTDLTVNNLINTTNFISTGSADVSRLNFAGNVITDYTPENIILRPSQLIDSTLLYTPNDINFDTAAGTKYFYVTAESWENSGAKIGSSIADEHFPEHTLVTGVEGPTNLYGIDVYKVWTNFAQSSNILHDTTVTILYVEPAIHFSGIGSTTGSTVKYRIVGTSITAEPGVDLNVNPTGSTNIYTSVLTNGNIHASGNITFDGDITLGNEASDVITFTANVGSNIVPDQTGLFDLGSTAPLNWLSVYSTHLYTTTFSTNTANIGTLNAGNVRISGAEISNITGTNDITLVNSSGDYAFNSFLNINGSTVTHLDSTVLQFVSTGNGYFKFGGDKAVVWPSGNTAQRPLNPEIGFVRYNTETAIPEVYANISTAQTVTTTTSTADVNIGDTTIYVDNTTGFKVGDYVSSSTVPGAFTSTTLITSIDPGISINVDTPAQDFIPTGSFIDVQRKWIPVIGTSPVLSYPEVEEIMDIWSLILC